MTTATIKRKKLRIREELLPDSAVYATIAEKEYVMIPVEEFGDWYEDIEDRILVKERKRFDEGPAVPLAEIQERIRREKARKR